MHIVKLGPIGQLHVVHYLRQTFKKLLNTFIYRAGSRLGSSISKTSILSRKSVKTMVKMNGYPSARVRLLMPPEKVSPQPPSPKRSVTKSPVRSNSKLGITRVDSKGYVVQHP